MSYLTQMEALLLWEFNKVKQEDLGRYRHRAESLSLQMGPVMVITGALISLLLVKSFMIDSL